jgi:hypothetical protein
MLPSELATPKTAPCSFSDALREILPIIIGLNKPQPTAKSIKGKKKSAFCLMLAKIKKENNKENKKEEDPTITSFKHNRKKTKFIYN